MKRNPVPTTNSTVVGRTENATGAGAEQEAATEHTMDSAGKSHLLVLRLDKSGTRGLALTVVTEQLGAH